MPVDIWLQPIISRGRGEGESAFFCSTISVMQFLCERLKIPIRTFCCAIEPFINVMLMLLAWILFCLVELYIWGADAAAAPEKHQIIIIKSETNSHVTRHV